MDNDRIFEEMFESVAVVAREFSELELMTKEMPLNKLTYYVQYADGSSSSFETDTAHAAIAAALSNSANCQIAKVARNQ